MNTEEIESKIHIALEEIRPFLNSPNQTQIQSSDKSCRFEKYFGNDYFTFSFFSFEGFGCYFFLACGLGSRG